MNLKILAVVFAIIIISGCANNPNVTNQVGNKINDNEYCTYKFEAKSPDNKNGCLKEHERLGDNAEVKCCDGLKPIDPWYVPVSCRPDLKPRNEENCVYAGPFSQSRICTKCGNGVCEIPENRCNCPEDCSNENNCLKAGEGEGNTGQCCAGLDRIGACFEDDEGYLNDNGVKCMCQYHLGPCAPCGNGKCEKKFGENKCSCSKDCK